MSNWSETQIGLVYYSGIAITIILAILVLVCLHKKLQSGLAVLVGMEHAAFWGQVFRLNSNRHRLCRGPFRDLPWL